MHGMKFYPKKNFKTLYRIFMKNNRSNLLISAFQKYLNTFVTPFLCNEIGLGRMEQLSIAIIRTQYTDCSM